MNKEAHSHAEAALRRGEEILKDAVESHYRRATHLKVRAADELTKKQREELEAQKIAEQEQRDTEATDEWVREHGGW